MSTPANARWICVLIFAAALAAYFPALSAGFIWDDSPGHVTKPELRSLGGLVRIWTDVGATQQYYPLLHSAFWIEQHLWGDNPAGYHILNVLLHATSACLVGLILSRLSLRGAWFAAFLFALHPVAVESVAWISEQKNTLSTLFYLLAALAYLRYDDTRAPGAYKIATICFVCALLSKTVTATLPAALLVIMWWRHGRLSFARHVLPLLPWFGLGVAAGAMTAWVEHAQIGAQGSDFDLGAIERVLLAARASWFYLGKLLWPSDLIFIYPRWQIDSGEAWQWLFLLGGAMLIVLAWWQRERNRGPLAGLLFFIGTLFPALGFVNVFPFVYSYVADHFQYVAMLGILTLAASGAALLTRTLPRWAAGTGAALVLLTLGILTWRQATTYRDVFSLYTGTLARNPACWMAHNNLAIALVDAGRAAEALPHYEKALAIRPRYAEAENNYGYALNQLGRPAEALPHLQRALQLKPGYAEAHNNLGGALMRLDRAEEGIAAFSEAVRLHPRFALAHCNLGLALATHGRAGEAVTHFETALRIDPRYADAELNWAIALTVSGQVLAALPHFDRALQLNPHSAQAHLTHGRALASLGRLDEAISHFRAALELQPQSGDIHLQLAVALRQSGRTSEAETHLQAAQQLGPGR